MHIIKQVPLVIVDLLVFVVYAMERANLEARMGVIVTLVSTLASVPLAALEAWTKLFSRARVQIWNMS